MSTERINQIKAIASAWISSADTKAAALAGISNILLGAIFLSNHKPDSSDPGWTTHLPPVFIVLVALLHVLVAVVLWPRTNRKRWLDEELPLPKSSSHFAEISRMSFREFKTQATANEEADTYEQAYVLARIASRKMFWYRAALITFLAALVAFAIMAWFQNR